MTKFLRIGVGTSLLCLLGSLAALIAGVGQVEIGPPLRFESNPYVVAFGADWSGEQEFKVAVVNDSGQPARIIGTREFCGTACFSAAGLPTEIPAWGRGAVNLLIKPNRPGKLSNEVVFFTDQASQPQITLKVEGTIPETVTQGDSTVAANP